MYVQVSELYELVKKWEAVGDSLPQVVDRMVALKDLHEQGREAAPFRVVNLQTH